MQHGLGMRAVRDALHGAPVPIQSRCLRWPNCGSGTVISHRILSSSLPGHPSSAPFEAEEEDAIPERTTHLHRTIEDMTSGATYKTQPKNGVTV